MQKRLLGFITLLIVTLMISFFVSPTPTLAITKVTPTPDPSDSNTSPDEIDVQSLLEDAIEKLDAEDYAGAISNLEAIIDVDEMLWDAYYFRAFAYAQIGDFNRAIDDYTRAINIRYHDWTSYTLRASMYVQLGELGLANLDYDQALFFNPLFGDAYAGKAILYLQLNDPTLSDIFQGIIEAMGASANGNVNESIDILTSVIESVDADSAPPELGYVYFIRSNTHIRLGNWDEALDDMNRAIELQPEMQDYYMARGFVYSETSRLALAAPDFYQRMTLLEVNSIEAELSFGQTTSIEMDYGTVARLTFDGNEGQQVTITARDSLGVGVDPLLVLLDEDGTPIVGNDDGGGELDSLINDFILPDDGTYTVVVSHANGGFTGTINISLK